MKPLAVFYNIFLTPTRKAQRPPRTSRLAAQFIHCTTMQERNGQHNTWNVRGNACDWTRTSQGDTRARREDTRERQQERAEQSRPNKNITKTTCEKAPESKLRSQPQNVNRPDQTAKDTRKSSKTQTVHTRRTYHDL